MNADSYYAREGASPPLQQGDIVLAPLGRVEATPDRPGRWDALDEFTIESPRPPSGLDPYIIKSGYQLAMVTSHDCQLDKEFLEAYERYRKDGLSKEDAARLAEDDDGLDRFLTVSPLVALNSLRPTRESIMGHHVLGFFPVPVRDEVGIEEAAVDLTYRATVERHAIIDRVAVLSEQMRLKLRFALARLDALRTPAIGFELEAAVGQRITAVRRSGNPGGTMIALGNGEELELLLQPARVAGGGAARSRAPAVKRP